MHLINSPKSKPLKIKRHLSQKKKPTYFNTKYFGHPTLETAYFMPMRWGWFFKLGARHQIGDGARTQFWFDIWAGPRPLRDRFPNLFSICDNPLISVASACNTDLGIRFRRTFSQLASEEWRLLQSLIHDTSLGQGQDKISWGLHPSGEYTVNFMYSKLSQGASVAHFKDLWAAKLPLKIKIFSWQLALGRLLSSKHITSRHGPASGRYALCNRPESVNHIFFSCSLYVECCSDSC
jgi:hypothetical protein